MSASREKELAAISAVNQVQSGMTVGLGFGSTAYYAVKRIGELLQEKQLQHITGVVASEKTSAWAKEFKIPLCDLNDVKQIDLAIDGADEFDPELNLIKGGGGALLREKIVAFLADRFIVVADSSKQVACLGAFPLPVEVLPIAVNPIMRLLNSGPEPYRPQLRLQDDGSPYLTDNGNYILDCDLKEISDPEMIDYDLSGIPGIVENGLFLHMTDELHMGKGDQVIIFK